MPDTISEFLKPRKVRVEPESATRARIIIEPFERGFGHTLGNALRRILLSSMPGAAVTDVGIPAPFKSRAGKVWQPSSRICRREMPCSVCDCSARHSACACSSESRNWLLLRKACCASEIAASGALFCKF